MQSAAKTRRHQSERFLDIHRQFGDHHSNGPLTFGRRHFSILGEDESGRDEIDVDKGEMWSRLLHLLAVGRIVEFQTTMDVRIHEQDLQEKAKYFQTLLYELCHVRRPDVIFAAKKVSDKVEKGQREDETHSTAENANEIMFEHEAGDHTHDGGNDDEDRNEKGREFHRRKV